MGTIEEPSAGRWEVDGILFSLISFCVCFFVSNITRKRDLHEIFREGVE